MPILDFKTLLQLLNLYKIRNPQNIFNLMLLNFKYYS
jgi:hypothetical protein